MRGSCAWICTTPHYHPQMPSAKYHTILCTYVLNVVGEAEGHAILQDIRSRLLVGGSAYITVRRDFDKDYTTRAGVRQRLVYLSLPIVSETADYCIYEMRRS